MSRSNLRDGPPQGDPESEGEIEGGTGERNGMKFLSLPSPRTPSDSPRTPPRSSRPSTASAPRRKEYSVYELLQDFNYDKVIAMKDEFKNGISLKEFINLFGKIKGQELDQDLIIQLCNLFDEVDVNGSNDVSLEELTNFIVQSGLEPNFKQNIQQYEQISITVEDNNFMGLQKVKYIPEMDRVVVCDKSTKDGIVRLMRFHTFNGAKELRVAKELKGHTGTVINCAYEKEDALFATSSLDYSVRIWDCANHWKFRSFTTKYPQLALTFVNNPSRLANSNTSDTMGVVRVWSVNGDQTGQNIAEFFKHTDMTMDLAAIPNTTLLASASLDSKIILWDLGTGISTKEFSGHTKGVFSLGYAQDYRILISAGSDRLALAWNPIANRQSPIFRLRGHHTSLVGVDTGRAPLVVTADISGMFKLWDIRTYECIQTFKTDPQLVKTGEDGELVSFTTCGNHNMLLAGGNHLLALKYDRTATPFLTDEIPLLTACYNFHTRTILTATKKSLRVWDAHTGGLWHSMTEIAPAESEITAVYIDDTGRRIFVGDSDGNINVYNYSNGTLYSSYTKHSSQIIKIWECPLTHNVYSVSSRSICSHYSLEYLANALPPPTSTRVRVVEVKDDVTSITSSATLALIAAACFGKSGPVLTLWDAYTIALDASFSPNSSEITAVQFLDPYPLICTADSSGCFVISTVRPFPQKNRVLYSMENFCSGSLTSTIQEMAFFQQDKILFTGDESGELKAWNLHNFILNVEIYPVEVTNNAVTYKSKVSTNASIALPVIMAGEYSDVSFESFMGPFLLYKWKGHYSGLTSLAIIGGSGSHLRGPPHLLSTGKDCRARMWSITGKYLGTLRDNRDESNADSWLFQPATALSSSSDIDIASLAALNLQDTGNIIDDDFANDIMEIPLSPKYQLPKPIPLSERASSANKKNRRPPSTYRASIRPLDSTSPLAKADRSSYRAQVIAKEQEEESDLYSYLVQVSKNTQKKYSENQQKAADKFMSALDSLNT